MSHAASTDDHPAADTHAEGHAPRRNERPLWVVAVVAPLLIAGIFVAVEATSDADEDDVTSDADHTIPGQDDLVDV